MTTLKTIKTEKRILIRLFMSLIVIISFLSCDEEQKPEQIIIEQTLAENNESNPRVIALANDTIYKISDNLVKFPHDPSTQFVKAPIVSAFIDTTNNQNKLCATIVLCTPENNKSNPYILLDSLNQPKISNDTLLLEFHYANMNTKPDVFQTWIMHYEYDLEHTIIDKMKVTFHNDDPKTSRGTLTVVQKQTH